MMRYTLAGFATLGTRQSRAVEVAGESATVGAETFVPKEFGKSSADLGNVIMYISPGQKVARWGGGCDLRSGISLATMYFSHTIALTHQINGFRGVC